MALLSDDPTAAAKNLPAPPAKLKWRLVRLASVRAICVAAFAEIGDECMVRARIAWPRGSFNPSLDPNIRFTSDVDFSGRRAEAAARVNELRDFHPGFPEVI